MINDDDAKPEKDREDGKCGCRREPGLERVALQQSRDQRMDDERRGEKMQPEGDVSPSRPPLRVRHVETHREREDAKPAEEREAIVDGPADVRQKRNRARL